MNFASDDLIVTNICSRACMAEVRHDCDILLCKIKRTDSITNAIEAWLACLDLIPELLLFSLRTGLSIAA
jgi:hypothetical protein